MGAMFEELYTIEPNGRFRMLRRMTQEERTALSARMRWRAEKQPSLRDDERAELHRMADNLDKVYDRPAKTDMIGPSGSKISAVSISLVFIAGGWIKFAIEAEGRRIEMWMDNLEPEEVQLVQFIQVLATGGFPLAPVGRVAVSHFTVAPSADKGCCRLVVNFKSEGIVQIIDVITSQDELAAQLSGLASAIGTHPCYVHEYLLHGGHPDVEYDRASEMAEAEWNDGVREGRFIDDEDVKTDFIARQVSSSLTLPEDRLVWAEDCRKMLLTLQIPEELAIDNAAELM